jgi:hypothetical protein
MHTLTLKLGESSFEIRPLTCGQIEDIQDLLLNEAKADGADKKKISTAQARAIIAVGLREDYPETTSHTITKIRFGTIKVLNDAMMSVLRFGGFAPDKAQQADAKEPPPGESQGAA